MPNDRGSEKEALEAPRAAKAQLDDAVARLELARSLLELRHVVAHNIRSAIRCLLAAQEKLESGEPLAAVELELVSTGLWVGAAEHEIKARGAKDEVEPAQKVELRAFPRFPVRCPVELEPDLMLSAQEGPRVPITGSTINLSRGGVLAFVDQGILRNGRYLVHLDRRGEGPSRNGNWGMVRRAGPRDVGWEVGIEFEQPLSDLHEFLAPSDLPPDERD